MQYNIIVIVFCGAISTSHSKQIAQFVGSIFIIYKSESLSPNLLSQKKMGNKPEVVFFLKTDNPVLFVIKKDYAVC